MNQPERINYLEFPTTDLEASKNFFQQVFGWEFVEYGPDYAAFSAASAGIDGGFYRSELKAKTETGSVLVVLFSPSLEVTLSQIETAGGHIVKPIFSFPGGRRFQFLDPSGNEFAVWSDGCS
jgi:predicted enzyme related to lactoylglutathione lyase